LNVELEARAPLPNFSVGLVVTKAGTTGESHARSYITGLPRDALVAVWCAKNGLADDLAMAGRARGLQAYSCDDVTETTLGVMMCIVIGPNPFSENQLKILAAAGCPVEQRQHGRNQSLTGRL
jgi:hypothetical protein